MADEKKIYREVKGHYTENGQLAEHYFADVKSEECHGQYRKWYFNGQLQCDCEFHQGKLIGIARWWHENGRLQMVSEASEKEYQGLFVEWKDDGTIIDAEYHSDDGSTDIEHELEDIAPEDIDDEFIMMLKLKYYE